MQVTVHPSRGAQSRAWVSRPGRPPPICTSPLQALERALGAWEHARELLRDVGGNALQQGSGRLVQRWTAELHGFKRMLAKLLKSRLHARDGGFAPLHRRKPIRKRPDAISSGHNTL
eukprot:CAMPEP_0179129894 /NCGR_PEP_ID=MMETSP0796-20121207/61647_1 /TAXON_ID=73915 /ORGANISM="Pyrodinium bahamense, Strain pbaha01" /LENGTH=116 /DNA_ID=CAMNT_0020828783 /DNA_START=455 /DNA_END=802 /DNA_ORIENTATION=+